jgi:uncharacterized protein (DUF2249 family)
MTPAVLAIVDLQQATRHAAVFDRFSSFRDGRSVRTVPEPRRSDRAQRCAHLIAGIA